MLNAMRAPSLCLALVILAAMGSVRAQAVNRSALLPAPVPPQIGAAQKVFISNGGGANLDAALYRTVINGGPDRPYDEFYAAMKGWGRYQLVSSPADADVVFRISFRFSDTGLEWIFDQKGVTPVLGPLQLAIVDPKTRVALWTIVEYVPAAILLGNRDKNFDQSMNTLVDRLKKLVAPPKSAATP